MATFVFTPEQLTLRSTVREFLADKSPATQVRQLMSTDAGYDPAVWTLLAGQLGLTGLTVPEQYGGAGCGPVEQLIVCEEMGRALLCAPYLASAVLAATALLASADEAAQAELLPRIADGSVIATLAVPEADGAWRTAGLSTRADHTGGGYLLTGRKHFVLDGVVADTLLVAATAAGGPALFAVDAGASGLTRHPVQTVDLTRKLAVIELDQVPARLIGKEGDGERIADQAVLAGLRALAAELAGVAQRCLDMSVDYAKLRYQFGRPIGSFQAIKHKCAAMLLEVELARSAAYYTAWAAADADSGPDQALLARLAKARCADAACQVAAENIQIHGGIGFTWEHDAHLYYRRATSSAALLGAPAELREHTAAHTLG